MYLKLMHTAVFAALFLNGFCQDDKESVFTIKKAASAPVSKTYFYHHTTGFALDTVFSNIITRRQDSLECFSFSEIKSSKGGEGRTRKSLLYTADYKPLSDTGTITFASNSSNQKKEVLFVKRVYQSIPTGFSWSHFMVGMDTPVQQTAVVVDTNAKVKIDTCNYNCLHVVYARDTLMRNRLAIKIRARSWYGLGKHKETIVTHVYLRNGDYLPVQIIELTPGRNYNLTHYVNWEIRDLWLLKQKTE